LGWTSDAEWIDLDLAGQWPEERLSDLLDLLNASSARGIEFFLAAIMPPNGSSLAAEIAESTYVAQLPHPPFELAFGDLELALARFREMSSVVIQRKRKGRTIEMDIRPLVRELAVTAHDQVILTLATGSGGSVRPTEVLQSALELDESKVPLIRIHKVVATLGTGETPAAQALVMAQVNNVEKGNTHYGLQPARDACGYPGG
jgi:radical SAM-linked protein